MRKKLCRGHFRCILTKRNIQKVCAVIKDKLNYLERPIVHDLKPHEGPTTSETECWIKGQGFLDRNNDCTILSRG